MSQVIPFPAARSRRVEHDDKPLRPTWATGLGAGLIFKRVPADVDERIVEEDLGGLGAADVAQALAEVKAVEVSMRLPGDLVIGADQTLALGETRFHKPRDREEAGRQRPPANPKRSQNGTGRAKATAHARVDDEDVEKRQATRRPGRRGSSGLPSKPS